MIVVAIIGILAAVAIPAYQDYTVRAKVAEVMGLAAGTKVQIYEDYAANGVMPADASDIVVQMDNLYESSAFVNSAAYTKTDADNSFFTLTLENLTGEANTKTLIIDYAAGANGLAINCQRGTVPDKYLPANCRS